MHFYYSVDEGIKKKISTKMVITIHTCRKEKQYENDYHYALIARPLDYCYLLIVYRSMCCKNTIYVFEFKETKIFYCFIF